MHAIFVVCTTFEIMLRTDISVFTTKLKFCHSLPKFHNEYERVAKYNVTNKVKQPAVTQTL